MSWLPPGRVRAGAAKAYRIDANEKQQERETQLAGGYSHRLDHIRERREHRHCFEEVDAIEELKDGQPQDGGDCAKKEINANAISVRARMQSSKESRRLRRGVSMLRTDE